MIEPSCVHNRRRAQPTCASPSKIGEAPMPGDELSIESFAALVEAVVFPAKTVKGRQERVEFLDAVLEAGGGEVPTRPPAEWRRRFSLWRAAKNRPVHPCRNTRTVVGRQRVVARFRRAQRRPARPMKNSKSASDDGRGRDGLRLRTCTRAQVAL